MVPLIFGSSTVITLMHVKVFLFPICLVLIANLSYKRELKHHGVETSVQPMLEDCRRNCTGEATRILWPGQIICGLPLVLSVSVCRSRELFGGLNISLEYLSSCLCHTEQTMLTVSPVLHLQHAIPFQPIKSTESENSGKGTSTICM